MPVLVSEIMNHELFSLRPEERVDDALGYILALGISGAPVLDRAGKPLGMLSYRDAVQADPRHFVRDEMNTPVLSVRQGTSIEEAGRLMAESQYHRLVVVDERGVAVGVVSAIDVVRGLLGLPASHPAEFPHREAATGLTWTDDIPLLPDRIEAAPAGTGVVVLVHGGKGVRERVVWVEACEHVRGRLLELLTTPSGQRIAALLDRPGLRFRAATTSSENEARKVVDRMVRLGALAES